MAISTGSRGRVFLIVVLFSLGLLVMSLPLYRPATLPFIFLMLGRLHPLVLHFPIVLILLTMFFELAVRLRLLNIPKSVIGITLVAAALSAVLSIGAGFFLFASGDYSGSLMEQHLWGGSVSGALICMAAGFYLLSGKVQQVVPLYLISLLASNLAVAYTSHMGGSITHGEDYLTEYWPAVVQAVPVTEVPDEEALVYRDMVSPIFEANCVSCHNPRRAKGGYVMTSYQEMVKGGKSGKTAIEAGHTADSELFNRITMAEGEDDRMPPQGKTPLNEHELLLIKYWIEKGAGEDIALDQLQNDPTIAPVVNELLPALAKYRRQQAVALLKSQELEKELQELAQQLFITIESDSTEEGNLYAIRMRFPPAPFSNEQFRELAPYNHVFSKLSVVSSGIDDDGLYHLGKMENLKRLYLQKTRIKGSGLVHLMALPNLEVLNLSFTQIDDKAVLDLLKFPALKEVYLFGTNTSAEVVEAINKNRPGLKVIREEGPYF